MGKCQFYNQGLCNGQKGKPNVACCGSRYLCEIKDGYLEHNYKDIIMHLRQLRMCAMEDFPLHYKRYCFTKICYAIYKKTSAYCYCEDAYFNNYKFNLMCKYIDALYNKYIMNK